MGRRWREAFKIYRNELMMNDRLEVISDKLDPFNVAALISLTKMEDETEKREEPLGWNNEIPHVCDSSKDISIQLHLLAS